MATEASRQQLPLPAFQPSSLPIFRIPRSDIRHRPSDAFKSLKLHRVRDRVREWDEKNIGIPKCWKHFFAEQVSDKKGLKQIL